MYPNFALMTHHHHPNHEDQITHFTENNLSLKMGHELVLTEFYDMFLTLQKQNNNKVSKQELSALFDKAIVNLGNKKLEKSEIAERLCEQLATAEKDLAELEKHNDLIQDKAERSANNLVRIGFLGCLS